MFKCSFCELKFGTPGELAQHVARVHSRWHIWIGGRDEIF